MLKIQETNQFIMRLAVLITLTVTTFSCTLEKPSLQLSHLFSDHMVLQQATENAIWGTANPNAKVTVDGSWGASAETTAGPDGKWLARLVTPEAGGPFQVTVSRADSVVTISDVYAGEVWVASGQSNMEMPLKGWPNSPIDGSEEAIASADFPEIRMFTVKRNTSFAPLDTLSGEWKTATPESAGDFSATAWFFAKKVYEETGIPIGIIHTSWGGTPAQAWTTMQYLEKVPTYQGSLQELADYEAFYDSLNAIYSTLDTQPIDFEKPSAFGSLSLNDTGFEAADFDDSNWPSLTVPGVWEREWLPNFDGVVWMRTSFELTKEQAAMENPELFLGRVLDMDLTYVNGTKVGGTEDRAKWQELRIYPIPAGLLKAGKNVVAVKVFDPSGPGGIVSSQEPGIRQRGSAELVLSLKGTWKGKPVAESLVGGSVVKIPREVATPFKKPSLTLSPYSPSALYNAMINPVIPYGIRGAIWYQGEANVGAADVYRTLFPTMITNWRDNWGLGDFPFYFVQIAPYRYNRNDDMTARLRDAQASTLSLKNTGMAVIMDVGDPDDIHPANKKDVGERLALWALAKDYGVDVEYSGPVFASMAVNGNQISVAFSHASGLHFEGEPGFVEIAGNDGVFLPAKVKLEGDKLLASHPKITRPTAVRYGWCEACEPNLFNGAGLPAVPFNSLTK